MTAAALLQNLESFALSVTMFVIGFIATVATVIFIIAMHRSKRHQDFGPKEED